MLTSYGFRRPFRVCGLDCLLSLRPARSVSTRSLEESFARDCHAAWQQRFPRIWAVLPGGRANLPQGNPFMTHHAEPHGLGESLLSPLL